MADPTTTNPAAADDDDTTASDALLALAETAAAGGNVDAGTTLLASTTGPDSTAAAAIAESAATLAASGVPGPPRYDINDGTTESNTVKGMIESLNEEMLKTVITSMPADSKIRALIVQHQFAKLMGDPVAPAAATIPIGTTLQGENHPSFGLVSDIIEHKTWPLPESVDLVQNAPPSASF